MELINGKFRLLKIVNHSGIITTYLADDILKSEKVFLNIVKTQYLPDNFKVYQTFKNKYLKINSKYISKISDLGAVKSIDNRKINKTAYFFYTTEYIENIVGEVESIELDNIISLIVDVCKGLSYIHLQGNIYKHLNPSNIILSKDSNGKIRATLRDLITCIINDNSVIPINNDSIQYKAPEMINNQPLTVRTDIYSMGMIIKEKIITKLKYGRDLNRLSVKSDAAVRLTKLIRNMINKDSEKRFLSIEDLVHEINELFNKSHVFFDIDDMQRLNLDHNLYGMTEPMKMIIDWCNSSDNGAAIAFVHGGSGTGKTSFLKEFEWKVNMTTESVYASYSMDKNEGEFYKPLKEILSKSFNESKRNIIGKYEKDLNAAIQLRNECSSSFGIDMANPGDRYKLNSRLLNFICEVCDNNKNIIIIDNIHAAKENLFELLEMILSKNTIERNILLVVSYSDEEIWNNASAHRFVNKFIDGNKNESIQLKPLEREECSELIKDILKMPYIPVKFSRRIFNHTYGSPIFIKEVLKDLLAKRIIYVKKNSGEWACEIDDYEKIILPKNIVTASKGQLNEVHGECYEVLKILAVSKEALNIEFIKECSSLTEERIERILKSLSNKGIIRVERIEYSERFIFTNKMMKRVIYDEINYSEKIELNMCMARILEKEFLRNKHINLRDMIEYFEEAQEYDKVIKYCSILAEKMENANDKMASVELMEKAIRYSEEYTQENIKLRIRLATSYLRNGNKEKMTEILEDCLEVSLEKELHKLAFDILYRLIGNNMSSNDTEKCNIQLEQMFKLYKKTGNKEGYVQYLIKKVRILALAENRHKEALEFIEKAKAIDLNENYLLQGELYNTEGILHILNADKIEGMKSFKRAAKLYEKAKDIKGCVHVLNNLAVMSCEYFQNINEGLESFEKSCKLAEENKINELLPLIYSNIAELNIDMNNLKKGEEYLEKCSELVNESDFEHIMFLNIKLMLLNIEYGNFENLEQAFNKCKSLLNKNNESGRTVGEYYIAAARRAMVYGDFEEAVEHYEKAEEIFNDGKSKLSLRIKFLKKVSQDSLRGEFHAHNEIKFIENGDIITDKINLLFIFSVVYGINGKVNCEVLKTLLKDMYDNQYDELNYGTRLKLEIALGMIDHTHNIDDLTKMVEEIKEEKFTMYSIYGNFILAERFYHEKNYIHALNHYLCAVDCFKRVFLGLPDKYKEKFIDRFVVDNVLSRVKELEIYFTREGKRDSNTKSKLEKVKEVISFDFFKNITNSKSFGQYTKKLYKHKELYYIEGINDIIRNMYSEPEENLKFICNYIENTTLADKCMILKYSNCDLEVLYSSNGDYELPRGNIIDRVKITHEDILFNRFDGTSDEILSKMNEYTGVICIPIMEGSNIDIIDINNRKRDGNARLTGILYLSSKNILNNFNKKSFNNCLELIPLINSLMGSYEFKMISAIDKLTNVYTRKYLMDYLTHEIQKSHEMGKELSILMIDLDHFKNINDKFGHQKGDEVLAKACKVIKQVLRTGDIVGRYGGEEFLVMLPNTGLKNAVNVGERIRMAIKKANILGENYQVTTSIGISSYPEHSQLQEELIEKADKALYDAKEEGRDRVKRYTPLMEFQNKGANKLSGIITGNSVEDSRNVLTFIHVLDLVDAKWCLRKKIYKFLGRIVETTEAQNAVLFQIEHGEISKSFSRERYSEHWCDNINYNEEIVKDVVQRKEGLCTIDWNLRNKTSISSEMPEWNSIMCIPIQSDDEIKAVLMLQVPTSEKEFNYEHLNFVNVIVRIAKDIFFEESSDLLEGDNII